jgi:hypothetical protein
MDFQGSLPGIPVDEHKNTSDGLSPAACHFNQNMISLSRIRNISLQVADTLKLPAPGPLYFGRQASGVDCVDGFQRFRIL